MNAEAAPLYLAAVRAYEQAACPADRRRQVRCRPCAPTPPAYCAQGTCATLPRIRTETGVVHLNVENPALEARLEQRLQGWLRRVAHGCKAQLRAGPGAFAHGFEAVIKSAGLSSVAMIEVEEHGAPGSVENCAQDRLHPSVVNPNDVPFSARVRIKFWRP